ncbi:uncharacterized protein LOC130796753 isoform X1 [Amaranthus tricolor]|uniref:uncharacterized protein LOC130796753 isoform X1 n=1 Tax=Amaranthus tricolor TaxID=29722 RepID=UPI00258CCC8C|nr:uncharacterized protein LOC130796753 isoform X1 [Amaranthus tricolor]
MVLPRTVAVAASTSSFRISLTSLSTINYKFQLCHSSISLHCPRLQSTVACFSQQQNHSIRSPNLVALEYADLNLPHICVELGHIRVRQHVNPLSSALSVPAKAPDWNDVFKDPSLPLMIDIGCGSGRFLLWQAKQNVGSNNYLGLEIRKKLAERANIWAKELGLYNAYFMFANATVSFQQLASSYPGPLVLVSILCPDPHFKKKHHKRRVLQKPLVDSIVDRLTSGGRVFVQSDVHEVAVDMRTQFDFVSNIQHVDIIDPNFVCDPDGWLLKNPMGIRTEREIHAELECAKIYRRMYQKRT